LSEQPRVVYICPAHELELLVLKVDNGRFVELPQFPGLLCKISRMEFMLKFVNYGVLWLYIEGFYKDVPDEQAPPA
jgi:hypothetical protein